MQGNYKVQRVQQVWLCTETYLGLKTELSEYEIEILGSEQSNNSKSVSFGLS